MKKIISIYSLKGGVGKTTLTYQLLAALTLRGFSVAGVDMDRRQALSDLLEDTDIPCYSVESILTRADIDELDYDFILIDGTPETSDNILKSIALSDYVLIPTVADQINVNLLMSELSVLFFSKLHQVNPELKASLIVNMTNPYQLKDVSDFTKFAREELSNYIPSLNENEPIIAKIGSRSAIKAVANSKTVFDSTNYKAKNELFYLADKLIELIGVIL